MYIKSLRAKVIAGMFVTICLLSYGLTSKNQGRTDYSADQLNHLTEEAYQYLYPLVLILYPLVLECAPFYI